MMSYNTLSHPWLRCIARLVGALAMAIILLASAAQAADYSVLVGYADDLRASPLNFPTPWEGSPGVIFEGCSPSVSCTFDAGAVRIVNNTGGTLTVDSVIVHLDTCTFDLWPHNVSLPFGGQLIVTQTTSGATNGCSSDGHFDTSDIGPGGVGWAGMCSPSGVTPTIDVTVNGVTTTFSDTGQVLNTGGIDLASCPSGTNESTQWTSIGSPPCPSAVLTLAPLTQSDGLGTTATVTANLTNSCGTPLSGVNVDFAVLAGPNVGDTGMDTTDSSGDASFSYTSSMLGTDTLQASVTNLAGTITSNEVTVIWLDRTPPGAKCVQTTNPSGNNVPKAGTGTGKSGQNPDGFYQLFGSDNVAVASIVVRDGGSPFVSGPFANGDKVKITQAPGVTPSDNRPGPGVIVSHLMLKGDAILRVTDTSGNVTEVSCLVPPPPK